MLYKSLTCTKILRLRSQCADPAPPLGTVLGNLGVNTVNFCTQFNNYTKDLPNYFILNTFIDIKSSRSFTFKVSLPSASNILNLLKFSYTFKVKINGKHDDKIIFCVKLYEVLKLTKLKFGVVNINTFKIILGLIKSHGFIVVRDSKNLPKNIFK